MFRIATGIVIVLIALSLLLAGSAEGVGAMIPGIVFLVVGIAILVNKHEDDIEEIKSDND